MQWLKNKCKPVGTIRPVLILIIAAVMFTPVQTARAKYIYSDAALIDGFNRTVFGSEFSNLLTSAITPPYVRKFTTPVRFYVRSTVGNKAKAHVQDFINQLDTLIHRLSVKLVSREEDANFVVHVVKRNEYADTVRRRVYRRSNARIAGRCMVRSIYSRRGISRSDAVIVANEGDDLFKRCTIEEILQGLGPLNDDPVLSNSMFNDTSPFTRQRLFDRYILNMLYDRQVRPGASREMTNRVLPKVLTRVRHRLEPKTR